MTGTLLVAGFSCLAAGAGADLAAGARRRALRALPYALALAGSALLLAAGVRVLAGGGATWDLGSLLSFGTTTVRADRLAGLFLVLLFGLGTAVSAAATSLARREPAEGGRGLGAGFCLLLGSVGLVVIAGDAFSFLMGWELLTLSFYILSAIGRRDRSSARAAWLTLTTGKVSGACLLFGFLLLSGASGSFVLASWHGVGAGSLHDFAYAFLVVGFAAKLGVVPLQVFMPAGYPAAPPLARAAMAGVAANVGVYGMWRTLSLLGRPPVWLVVGTLLAGGVTALLGIAFAGVEGRLSRVLAYSSVENAGIVITAYGVALAGSVTHSPELEAAGLLAAGLHTVAHAVAKSLLFASSARFETAVASDDLARLRGIGRSMPLSGLSFAAGALTLAGLPPTVGFVSEWFVLEALMQEFRVSGLAVRLAMAGAGALVALTAGLAALAFVRILGLVVLGRRAGEHDRPADRGIAGKVALGALGGACFAVAAVTPLEIRLLARGLAPVIRPAFVTTTLKSPWVLQPTYAGFSILSPSWLYVAMPLGIAAVTVTALVLSRGRYFRVRRVPAWRSATTGVEGPSSYTAFAFANPLRHVLANVLGTRREETLLESRADVVRGRGRVEYVTVVVEPVEHYLYRPLRRALLATTRQAKRLQSGRVEAYVGYMLFALVVALAVTAGLH